MTKVLEYILGFLAFIGLASLVSRSKVVDASKETKKIDDKISEIKEKTDETPIDDLVSKSNKRYGPGSRASDS